MLKKSVDLHMKMVDTEIKVSAFTMFCMGLALTFSPLFAVFTFLIFMVILTVSLFKGTKKLFGGSLYGSEGELYQVLPLTPREILFGKALTMVVWQAVLLIVFLVPLIANLFSSESYLKSDLLEVFVQDLLNRGMHPVQIGILAGLAFFGLLISEFAYCMFLVLVQIFLRRLAPAFAKKMSDRTGVIIAMLIYAGISSGFDALSKLVVQPGNAVFYFLIAKYLLLAAIGLVLYRFCRENLERGFEQEYAG